MDEFIPDERFLLTASPWYLVTPNGGQFSARTSKGNVIAFVFSDHDLAERFAASVRKA